VSARCALTESVLTQKFRRDSLKVCVGGNTLRVILFMRNN
jgi:hypothetical protein